MAQVYETAQKQKVGLKTAQEKVCETAQEQKVGSKTAQEQKTAQGPKMPENRKLEQLVHVRRWRPDARRQAMDWLDNGLDATVSQRYC